MKHAGNELKKRRTELKRSADDASLACSIPKDLIHAIEEGDLEKLPHHSFVAGLVRSYCQYLDLPPEGYITKLQESLSGVEHASALSLKGKAPRHSRLNFPNLGICISKELQTWVAVSALLLLGWFAYSSVVRPNADITQSHAQAASIETPAERQK